MHSHEPTHMRRHHTNGNKFRYEEEPYGTREITEGCLDVCSTQLHHSYGIFHTPVLSFWNGCQYGRGAGARSRMCILHSGTFELQVHAVNDSGGRGARAIPAVAIMQIYQASFVTLVPPPVRARKMF